VLRRIDDIVLDAAVVGIDTGPSNVGADVGVGVRDQ